MKDVNKLVSEPEKILTDNPTSLVTYIGYAEFGASESDPVWIIQKITLSSTAVPYTTTFKWATGFKNNTNIWANRTSLTYVS